jgi:hypothetical protein
MRRGAFHSLSGIYMGERAVCFAAIIRIFLFESYCQAINACMLMSMFLRVKSNPEYADLGYVRLGTPCIATIFLGL